MGYFFDSKNIINHSFLLSSWWSVDFILSEWIVKERQLIAEKEITINAYDIDARGIVSNIVYIRWFEDLRMMK